MTWTAVDPGPLAADLPLRGVRVVELLGLAADEQAALQRDAVVGSCPAFHVFATR